jgi:hypothetical protein
MDWKAIIDSYRLRLGFDNKSFHKENDRLCSKYYLNYVETLKNIVNQIDKTSIEDSPFFQNTFLLLASSYFCDTLIDINGMSSDDSIESIFMFAALYSDFKVYLESEYRKETIVVFDQYVASQIKYQKLEKQWDNPIEYINMYKNYTIDYSNKAIIWLFPIELLTKLNVSENNRFQLLNLFKLFFAAVFCIDDIGDVENDIKNKTLTPIIAKHYINNNEMPKTDCDLSKELKESFIEFYELVNKIKCFQDDKGINCSGIIEILEKMSNKYREMI